MSSTLFSSMSPFPAGYPPLPFFSFEGCSGFNRISPIMPPLFNDEEMKRREVSLNLTGAESSDESSQFPF